MRIRIRFFYFIIFALFLPTLSFAAPTTGPITPDVILHFHPELNALGTAYRVPVVVGGVTGVAEIAAKRTVGALLGDMVGGLLGPWGVAAITAAQLCYEQTNWKICHSTIDPIVPITIDTSKIIPATSTLFFSPKNNGTFFPDRSSACTAVGPLISNSTYTFVATGVYTDTSDPFDCQMKRTQISNGSVTTGTYSSWGASVYHVYKLACSNDSVLTNSSGAPMAVTGQSCTPNSAYSCPTNYARSDAYGNLSDSSMFCSYQSPSLTDDQTTAQLKAVLLQYYADQLFKKADGTTDNSPFQQSDTTFDPSATPSSMPMTWDQLKQYVDWIRNGTAQTTDPLAPHYITPNNYDYTKTYITNNNTATTTNNSTSTNSNTVTPADAASSAAMTQSQYEASNQKFEQQKADAFTSSFAGVTNVLTQYNADKQEMISKIGSPTAPPAAMPNVFTWLWPTGQCNGFTLNLNIHVPVIGSLTMNKLVNEYCPPYRDYIHPAFFWFFNMITALYIFRLWDKTAADVAKI